MENLNSESQALIEQALNDYLGWFDHENPDDQETINDIQDALNAKNPLTFSITDEAMQNYRDYLINSVEQSRQFNDQDPKDVIQWQQDIDQLAQLLQH